MMILGLVLSTIFVYCVGNVLFRTRPDKYLDNHNKYLVIIQEVH